MNYMKKKHLLKFLFIAAAGSMAMMACNNTDPVPPPEKLQKLIQTDWKINDITVPKKTAPGGDSSISLTCSTDDLILFGANGIYDFQDGTAKCDSNIFNYSQGYWGYDLDNDSVQLAVITPTAKYVSWKVLTLNDSVLKATYIDSVVPANKIIKTISFKK
ncbi:hypothetical protein BH10BAC2_BH10BAC2_32680 [soil metagenome]